MNTLMQDYEDAPLLDLRTIFDKLLARRWWLIGTTLLFAIGFGVAAFIIEPTYRATALLVPVERTSDIGGALGRLDGIASMIGLGGGSRTTDTSETLAVLKSREFTEKFIVDHALLPRLYPEKWDSAAKRWKASDSEAPTLGKAYKKFDMSIRSISQDRKTGLVTLQIDWRDRNEAAAWANELAARVNAEMRKRAIIDADASVTYLEKEMQATTTVGTRDAISRLMEAQIKQRMLANVTEEYAVRIVDRALPPDADDFVWPRKFRMIALGGFTGFVIAALGILVSGSLRSRASGPAGANL